MENNSRCVIHGEKKVLDAEDREHIPATIEADTESLLAVIRDFWIPDTLQDINLSTEEIKEKRERAYYVRKIDNHLEIGFCEINFIC